MNVDAVDAWPPLDTEIEQAVLAQLGLSTSIYDRSGVIEKVEDKWRTLTGAAHALLVSSGTAGLHSAYYAAGLGPGDEVIVPAYTFFATATPLLQLGVMPILADTNDRGELALDEARRVVTEKTKALVITHMWGTPTPVLPYREFCDELGLALIEDCSHAHGASLAEGPVGSLADVAVASLQAAKTVAAGEGGILWTSNDEYYWRALLLGHFNKRAKAEIPRESDLWRFAETGTGLKYRIHALGAALANEYLDRLEGWLDVRQEFGKRMLEIVSGNSMLSALNPVGPSARSTYYALALVVPSSGGVTRQDVAAIAQEVALPGFDIPGSTRSLSTMEIFRNPISPVAIYDGSSVRRPTPVAELISDSVVKVPVPSVEGDTADNYLATFERFVDAVEKKFRATPSKMKPSIEVPAFTQECADVRIAGDPADGISQTVVGVVLWRRHCSDIEYVSVRRRLDDFFGGMDEIPGGGVEAGETIWAAIVREIHEETGVVVGSVSEYLGTFDYVNESGGTARQYSYSVEVPADTPILLDGAEHTGFEWVSGSRVSEINYSDETRRILLVWRARTAAAL